MGYSWGNLQLLCLLHLFDYRQVHIIFVQAKIISVKPPGEANSIIWKLELFRRWLLIVCIKRIIYTSTYVICIQVTIFSNMLRGSTTPLRGCWIGFSDAIPERTCLKSWYCVPRPVRPSFAGSSFDIVILTVFLCVHPEAA